MANNQQLSLATKEILGDHIVWRDVPLELLRLALITRRNGINGRIEREAM